MTSGAEGRLLVACLCADWCSSCRDYRPTFDALCIPPSYHGLPIPIGALVRALRGSKVVTHVWTINDPRHALRLWEQGVNGIISDDPAAILAVRR